MGVDGLVGKGIRYVGTRVGVKRAGFGWFVREGPKCFYYGVGRVVWRGKRASQWGKRGSRELKEGRWTCW